MALSENFEVAETSYYKARSERLEFYKASGLQEDERRLEALVTDDEGVSLYDEDGNWIGVEPEPSKEALEPDPALQNAFKHYQSLLKAEKLARIIYLEAGGPSYFPGELETLRNNGRMWLTS